MREAQIARLIGTTLLVAAVPFILPTNWGSWQWAVLGVVAFMAGCASGSWWAIIVVPLAFVGGFWLWRVVHCGDCPQHHNVNIVGSILLLFVSYTPIGLAAGAGAWVGKAVEASRRATRSEP